MSFKKTMKGLPCDQLPAKGLLYQDWSSLTPCQRECIAKVGMTIQTEQEAYLSQHPEIKVMLSKFVSRTPNMSKSKFILLEAANFFTRPAEVVDEEIREILHLPHKGSYTIAEEHPNFKFDDDELEVNLQNIIASYYPPDPWEIIPETIKTPNTVSSSFLSVLTSDTTLPTPEPIPTPEPTISETFFALISTTVDKAVFSHVDERALYYDTAYVELTKAVESAMEIPVIKIKEDIAALFYNAYQTFELVIMEKERIAADIAWEKRMRKKLKRTLRRQENFKGYETPPTPRSEISSHESYKKPPPKPCTCHPQFSYNRYAKDRFGIYTPRETEFVANNVTTTPAISMESIENEPDDKSADVKSIMSKKSTKSGKSIVSKKIDYAK